MANENSTESLADSWLKKLKNKPVIAALIVVAAVLPGIVSFGESANKLLALLGIHQSANVKPDAVKPETTANEKMPSPDYSHHTLLVDPSFLHPTLREKAGALLEMAQKENINLHYYETYRGPEKQKQIFGSGAETSASVERDAPWASLKQYGLSVSLLPYGSNGWMHKPQPSLIQRIQQLANTQGLVALGKSEQSALKQLTFTLAGIDLAELQQGHYPSGGDATWAENLNNQIDVWGSQQPAAPQKYLLSGTARN